MNAGTMLVVWTDIPAAIEAEFNDWYNFEHLHDRVGRMPGFQRGRRYVRVTPEAGAPKYLTLYDLTSADAMLSPGHAALRRERPPRDLEFVPMFRNTIKGICDVAGWKGGAGDGGLLVLCPVKPREPNFGARVTAEVLPRLAATPGVVKAVVALRNDAVTRASSAKDDRSGDRYADGLLVAEVTSAAAARDVAARITPAALAPLGGDLQFVTAPAVLQLIYELREG